MSGFPEVLSVQPGWATQRVLRYLCYKVRQSQKLKKGDKEGEEGRERERGRRKKGAMARVKGMCLKP